MALSDFLGGLLSPAVIITEIGTLSIDASISQDHRFPSRITENPVEDGSTVADHVVLLPIELEIDGRVTDTSMIGSVGVAEAYRTLRRLQDDRVPFSVVTGLSRYENMLLENLSVPRSADNGKSLRFTASLKEAIIVGSLAPTNRTAVSEDVRHTALPVRNGGFVTRISG